MAKLAHQQSLAAGSRDRDGARWLLGPSGRKERESHRQLAEAWCADWCPWWIACETALAEWPVADCQASCEALCDKKFETSLTPEFTGEGKTEKIHADDPNHGKSRDA